MSFKETILDFDRGYHNTLPSPTHSAWIRALPRKKKSVPISFRVIPSSFRVHSESFRPTYGFKKKLFYQVKMQNSDQIPTKFRVNSGSIPSPFRPNSDQIPTKF